MARPALHDSFRTLYTSYGYGYTQKRLRLRTPEMRELIDDLALEPCPRSHVLLRYLAADVGRSTPAVWRAAVRDGVLRRTRPPGGEHAGAISVPKSWAGPYREECAAYDRITDLHDAGWLPSSDVAQRFDRVIGVVSAARDGEGELAPYLADARHERHKHFTAWHPADIDTALARYRADLHDATTSLVPMLDIVRAAPVPRQAVRKAVRRLQIITCRAPSTRRRRNEPHLRPADAARLRTALGMDP